MNMGAYSPDGEYAFFLGGEWWALALEARLFVPGVEGS